jgi:hypothetical protein
MEPTLPVPSPKFVSKSEVDRLNQPTADLGKVNLGKNTMPLSKKSKKLTTIGVIAILILSLIVIPIVYTASVALKIKSQAGSIQTHAQAAMTALKAQDLPTAKVELDASKAALDQTQATFKHLAFLKMTPFKAYYQDGDRVFNAGQAGIEAGQAGITAIEPYADVLGLKGAGTFAGGTAEDRLVKLVGTLESLTPAFSSLQQKISYMDDQVSGINPKRYPFKLKGQSVGDTITKAKGALAQADSLITQFKPIVEIMPDIMGAKGDKKYLVLFQNDAEQRATGGFLTAYAIVNVKSGKVTPEKSDDMYDLDAKFKEVIAPPEVLKKHLLVSSLHLRDMNLSPDFKNSMDQFMGYFNKLPGEPKVDGVIAIDTQVLTDLLTVLGPVDVPGFGKFSADIDPRCNCPQVIYEMEDIIGRPTPYLRSDRKAILGPMMQTILYKAYGSGSENWPALFGTIFKDINEKHILFYFPDPLTQAAVEANNFAGRIKEYAGDYLHINDSNFGGAKSNMFITQEVDQDIKIDNGQVTKTLTMTYKNPTPGSNCNLEAGKLCLNGVLGNWQRLYLPPGSKLVNATGYLEGSVKEGEDLGKTVIEGFFKLAPESQAKITVTYTVPYQPKDNYQLLIQKQPGTKNPHYTLNLNGSRQEFDLTADKELSFPL